MTSTAMARRMSSGAINAMAMWRSGSWTVPRLHATSRSLPEYPSIGASFPVLLLNKILYANRVDKCQPLWLLQPIRSQKFVKEVMS